MRILDLRDPHINVRTKKFAFAEVEVEVGEPNETFFLLFEEKPKTDDDLIRLSSVSFERCLSDITINDSQFAGGCSDHTSPLVVAVPSRLLEPFDLVAVSRNTASALRKLA